MILLMGLPGSGKGTQGTMLADNHDLHLISMGDLVRENVTGERRQQMLDGILLDDTEIIAMIDHALSSVEADFILDGFPRTIPQAQWLLEQVTAGRFKLQSVIYLKASRDAVIKRLTSRGRPDDKAEVIEARFKEYQNLTEPVVEWLKGKVDIMEIDAERPADVVNQDIVSQLEL